ncbi:hypothetical protein HSB1_13890 [Halogranum salarium B-1]|uniref:Uncharacterized protein n=1 Tax=Halogranum salarium B-1 TaxID=1210908 RepID=J3JH93_9EURY|nr:hypothetical protein HSB1_13890 [Halogranum salarium B-1]
MWARRKRRSQRPFLSHVERELNHSRSLAFVLWFKSHGVVHADTPVVRATRASLSE